MTSRWEPWLRQLAADGKGGLGRQGGPIMKSIDRNLPYSCEVAIPLDWSGDTFTASLRLSPDAADPTVDDFTIDVGDYEDGYTIVTLSLTKVETAALPADGDFDGLTELVFDLVRTPSGGGQHRVFAGVVQVSGKVTNG